MTVAELLERIHEEIQAGTIDPDSEVILATQPTYPFYNSIAGIATDRDIKDDEDEDDDEADSSNRLIICENSQLSYASKAIFRAAR